MEKLRECPLCASTPNCHVFGKDCAVICSLPSCHLEGPCKDTEAEAIAAWNRRPREDELVRILREIADYPSTQEGQDDWDEIEKGWEALADEARAVLAQREG